VDDFEEGYNILKVSEEGVMLDLNLKKEGLLEK
jgi:hypothetical protein